MLPLLPFQWPRGLTVVLRAPSWRCSEDHRASVGEASPAARYLQPQETPYQVLREASRAPGCGSQRAAATNCQAQLPHLLGTLHYFTFVL